MHSQINKESKKYKNDFITELKKINQIKKGIYGH